MYAYPQDRERPLTAFEILGPGPVSPPNGDLILSVLNLATGKPETMLIDADMVSLFASTVGTAAASRLRAGGPYVPHWQRGQNEAGGVDYRPMLVVRRFTPLARDVTGDASREAVAA